MTIGAIAFRLWRPFTRFGPFTITGSSSIYEAPSPSSVTQYCQSGPLLPPWTTSSLASFVLPTNVVPVSATTFDTWTVVIPLAQPLQFRALGNLHITLDFGFSGISSLSVDAAADGGLYAYKYATGSGNPVFITGVAPVIGLIAALPSVPPALTPRLQILGEPMLGRTLEAIISRAPAGGSGAFVYGFETSLAFTPCTQFVQTSTAVSEFAGFNGVGYWQRWPQLAVPLNPSLLFASIVYQAVTIEPTSPSGFLLSNGVRVTFGGGL